MVSLNNTTHSISVQYILLQMLVNSAKGLLQLQYDQILVILTKHMD